MSDQQEEAKPQFIQRPMALFNALSKERAHPYIWLLCEYVTRWTVNWYNSPYVMLSADEFMHGRRKPNSKERYDWGLPIASRTSVLRYLALAVEAGYLEEEETGDTLGRKAYCLPPWYHPDTCTQYEQVEMPKRKKKEKSQKPVHEMDRGCTPDEQVCPRPVQVPPSPVQVASPQPAPEAPRDVPIETSLETFHKKEIETSRSISQEQKEEMEHKKQERERLAASYQEKDREQLERVKEELRLTSAIKRAVEGSAERAEMEQKLAALWEEMKQARQEMADLKQAYKKLAG